jgi:uncharacterized protein (DUF983 family)
MSDQNAPVRWQSGRRPAPPAWPVPSFLTALARGLTNRCPACGKAHVFRGYLKVEAACAECGAPLGELRADDAPPYFTIFIVGHVVVPLLFFMERWQPPFWLDAAIFLPLTLVMSLVLLRPVKGATVGLMLKLNMFKPADEIA